MIVVTLAVHSNNSNNRRSPATAAGAGTSRSRSWRPPAEHTYMYDICIYIYREREI